MPNQLPLLDIPKPQAIVAGSEQKSFFGSPNGGLHFGGGPTAALSAGRDPPYPGLPVPHFEAIPAVVETEGVKLDGISGILTRSSPVKGSQKCAT
jgi:hypothetical protein